MLKKISLVLKSFFENFRSTRINQSGIIWMEIFDKLFVPKIKEIILKGEVRLKWNTNKSKFRYHDDLQVDELTRGERQCSQKANPRKFYGEYPRVCGSQIGDMQLMDSRRMMREITKGPTRRIKKRQHLLCRSINPFIHYYRTLHEQLNKNYPSQVIAKIAAHHWEHMDMPMKRFYIREANSQRKRHSRTVSKRK